MTYQHPAADRHQQAAWIAFARTGIVRANFSWPRDHPG